MSKVVIHPRTNDDEAKHQYINNGTFMVTYKMIIDYTVLHKKYIKIQYIFRIS